jgi:hypothetical protein
MDNIKLFNYEELRKSSEGRNRPIILGSRVPIPLPLAPGEKVAKKLLKSDQIQKWY